MLCRSPTRRSRSTRARRSRQLRGRSPPREASCDESVTRSKAWSTTIDHSSHRGAPSSTAAISSDRSSRPRHTASSSGRPGVRLHSRSMRRAIASSRRPAAVIGGAPGTPSSPGGLLPAAAAAAEAAEAAAEAAEAADVAAGVAAAAAAWDSICSQVSNTSTAGRQASSICTSSATAEPHAAPQPRLIGGMSSEDASGMAGCFLAAAIAPDWQSKIAAQWSDSVPRRPIEGRAAAPLRAWASAARRRCRAPSTSAAE